MREITLEDSYQDYLISNGIPDSDKTRDSFDNWKQILKDREREQEIYTYKANEKTRKDFYNDCL